jgi:hypothetical protein
MKQLERRERRLMNEIATAQQKQATTYTGPPPIQPDAFASAHHHQSNALSFEQRATAGRSQQQSGGRVFRMDPSILGGGLGTSSMRHSGGGRGGAPATQPYAGAPSTELYFNFSQQQRAPPAVAALGVSRENPYLSKNIAEKQRSSMESGNSVTRRLEDYLARQPQQHPGGL